MVTIAAAKMAKEDKTVEENNRAAKEMLKPCSPHCCFSTHWNILQRRAHRAGKELGRATQRQAAFDHKTGNSLRRAGSQQSQGQRKAAGIHQGL
jgi:hypothetical protein